MAEALLLIVSVTLLCMLSPGPDMLLVMRNTLASDRRRGLLTSVGVLTGNLVHIAYCAFGVGWVIAHSIAAYSALKYAGAAYLVLLGVDSLRGAGREDAVQNHTPAQRAALGAFAQGLLNNLLNPKGALFYLGVFTQVIVPGTSPLQTAILIAAMISTSALFWVAFVFALQLGRVREVVARSRRAVDRAFGVLLIAVGLRVATQD
jgi:RhtB (resistance to homoserine/threonine) family protein